MWPEPEDVVQEPTVHLWQQRARLRGRTLEPRHVDVLIAGGGLVARRRPVRLEVMLVVINEVLPAGWWSVTPPGGWGACRGLGTGGGQSGQPCYVSKWQQRQTESHG